MTLKYTDKIPFDEAEKYVFLAGSKRGRSMIDFSLRELDSWRGWAEGLDSPSAPLALDLAHVQAYLDAEHIAARLEIEMDTED